MRRWWTGISGSCPHQEFVAAEAPAFANVALLVVGSSGITGAGLLDILESAATSAGPWKVYALLPPLSAFGEAPLSASGEARLSASGEACSAFDPNAVVHIELDLADAAAVSQALAPITDITHVFYGCSAWPEDDSAVLRNVLSAVVPSCPFLIHVCLHSRKQSTNSIEPLTGVPAAMRPCSEDLKRLECLDLEDALLDELTASRSDGPAITWSVHGPSTIFGLYPCSSDNVVASLCIYAAICRKEGVALRWPGSRVAWEGFCDASDAEFVAEHALWAALEPNGKINTFKFTNGVKWKQLWPALARHFQVEWSGYDGEHKRFKLVKAMAGKDIVWAQIVMETELILTKLDDVTTWWLVDAVINADKYTMNKNKEHGFLGFQNTVSRFSVPNAFTFSCDKASIDCP